MKTLVVFCPRTPRAKNRNLCWGAACSDSSVITIDRSSPCPPSAAAPAANSQRGQLMTANIVCCEAVRAASMLWARLVPEGAGIAFHLASISAVGYVGDFCCSTDQICWAKRGVTPSRAAILSSVAFGSPSATRCL